MTDELTDAELADLDRIHARWDHRCQFCNTPWPCSTMRLVAALRSERREIEITRHNLESCQTALFAKRAELERERTQNRELRLALPHYVTEHFRSCARFGIKPGSQLALPKRVCTCGLDDLLARAALSTQEESK